MEGKVEEQVPFNLPVSEFSKENLTNRIITHIKVGAIYSLSNPNIFMFRDVKDIEYFHDIYYEHKLMKTFIESSIPKHILDLVPKTDKEKTDYFKTVNNIVFTKLDDDELLENYISELCSFHLQRNCYVMDIFSVVIRLWENKEILKTLLQKMTFSCDMITLPKFFELGGTMEQLMFICTEYPNTVDIYTSDYTDLMFYSILEDKVSDEMLIELMKMDKFKHDCVWGPNVTTEPKYGLCYKHIFDIPECKFRSKFAALCHYRPHIIENRRTLLSGVKYNPSEFYPYNRYHYLLMFARRDGNILSPAVKREIKVIYSLPTDSDHVSKRPIRLYYLYKAVEDLPDAMLNHDDVIEVCSKNFINSGMNDGIFKEHFTVGVYTFNNCCNFKHYAGGSIFDNFIINRRADICLALLKNKELTNICYAYEFDFDIDSEEILNMCLVNCSEKTDGTGKTPVDCILDNMEKEDCTDEEHSTWLSCLETIIDIGGTLINSLYFIDPEHFDYEIDIDAEYSRILERCHAVDFHPENIAFSEFWFNNDDYDPNCNLLNEKWKEGDAHSTKYSNCFDKALELSLNSTYWRIYKLISSKRFVASEKKLLKLMDIPECEKKKDLITKFLQHFVACSSDTVKRLSQMDIDTYKILQSNCVSLSKTVMIRDKDIDLLKKEREEDIKYKVLMNDRYSALEAEHFESVKTTKMLCNQMAHMMQYVGAMEAFMLEQGVKLPQMQRVDGFEKLFIKDGVEPDE